MTPKPTTGDIWKYTRPAYSKRREPIITNLLILDDSPEDFYTCLNLDTGEVGDWMIDHSDEFDNWEFVA